MNTWKIFTTEENKTFEHIFWEKDSHQIKITRIFENVVCFKHNSTDVPTFIQNSGPYGNSVEILSENLEVTELINQKIEYLTMPDNFDNQQRSQINLLWNENKEQKLLEAGWNQIKREIWLSGGLIIERM